MKTLNFYHCLLLVALALNFSGVAMSQTAELSGMVKDPSQAAIPSATVAVLNEDTGIKRSTATSDQGYYTVPFLQPGNYKVTVQAPGFQTVSRAGIKLEVGQSARIDFAMPVGALEQSITVEAGAPLIQADSVSVGTVVNRQFVENLPLNGRSFHALIELTPGVVLTKTGFNSQGQFAVNGQRANANYFMVDGVSANVGVSGGNAPNQHAGGSLPALTAFGGTNNLASVDALQEFQIQTSSYAPEFGRTPGAQVSIVTRSGTNQFRGTLFNYFRNDALDANDWFANSRRLRKPPMRQNDFGGVLGGPILKNRTFFFFSYEGLRLRQPETTIITVPSTNARQTAPAPMKPFLNAFPVPNGPSLGNEFSEFAASYSNPSSLNATGIRVDHTLRGKLTLFGRYNHAPSGIDQRFVALSTMLFGRVNSDTLTAGATWVISPQVINDFRGNWSQTEGGSHTLLDDFGGAVPPPDSLLFPPSRSRRDALYSFGILGGTTPLLFVGQNVNNLQRQVNFIDNLSFVRGTHQLKFGVDYRWLSPLFGIRNYSQQAIFNGVTGALTGRALQVQITSNEVVPVFLFTNFSAFSQDTWKVTPRLTFTYGLRWEYNPPLSEKHGNVPYAVTGLDDPATMRLAPKGTPVWSATYDNFAPRVGVAYKLWQGGGTVFRGGFGVFYDLGNSQAANAAGWNVFPYGRTKNLLGVPYPLDAASAAPLPFGLDPPYGQMYVFKPNLKLPYSIQWNLAVEQSLGSNQTVSASYVAAAGRRLLRQELLASPNPNFTQVYVTSNAATSDYHALQLQFRRRLSRGLQALLSHTWSKSLDNVSDDSSLNIPGAKINLRQERGPSDFDMRHSFTAALSYNIPTPAWGGFASRAVLHGWSLDTLVRARSATPITVVTGTDVLRVGLTGVSRSDLVSGVPVWLDDFTVAGGKRINRAAFSVPTGRQGTLGRNALRGFGVSQMDFSIRRQFRLTERFSLQARADVFNVFNHPNFADPGNRLNNPLFGLSTQMLGRSLGTGGLTGGFSPLYQVGGPRSSQLALKLQF